MSRLAHIVVAIFLLLLFGYLFWCSFATPINQPYNPSQQLEFGPPMDCLVTHADGNLARVACKEVRYPDGVERINPPWDIAALAKDWCVEYPGKIFTCTLVNIDPFKTAPVQGETCRLWIGKSLVIEADIYVIHAQCPPGGNNFHTHLRSYVVPLK